MSVLLISNSLDATADYLADRLRSSGVKTCRLDSDLVLASAAISYTRERVQLSWAGRTMLPEDVKTVIYRRPESLRPNVEADEFQRRHAGEEWAEAIEGFLAHVPMERWINHPSRENAASHKVHQLASALKCGLAVPAWLVTTIPEEASAFFDACDEQVVVKTLSGGYIERAEADADTVIYTRRFTREELKSLPRVTACPVLFQRMVKKASDVRLVVVDDDLTAVDLKAPAHDGTQRLDIRRDGMRGVRYAQAEVPDAVASGVRCLMKRYGLRFAAMDFVVDLDGTWSFLEINPGGQWAWLDAAGPSDIAGAFSRAASR